jgi:hypothetical protein
MGRFHDQAVSVPPVSTLYRVVTYRTIDPMAPAEQVVLSHHKTERAARMAFKKAFKADIHGRLELWSPRGYRLDDSGIL